MVSAYHFSHGHIPNVHFRSCCIMMRVFLMVMLMAYSADTLNEKVIKEIRLKYGPVLEEFLRKVMVSSDQYTYICTRALD